MISFVIRSARNMVDIIPRFEFSFRRTFVKSVTVARQHFFWIINVINIQFARFEMLCKYKILKNPSLIGIFCSNSTLLSNNLPLDIIEEVEDPTAAEEEMLLNLEYFSVDVEERLLSNFCTNSDEGEDDEVFRGGGQ